MKLNKNPKTLTEPISRKWANQQQYLELLGPKLVSLVRERIERTKTEPSGRKWAPWASSTARARRREGTAGSGLLFRTGQLSASIHYIISGPKVAVRTNLPYAKYLQNGTSRMPARPFLGTGPKEEQAMQSLWKKWINS